MQDDPTTNPVADDASAPMGGDDASQTPAEETPAEAPAVPEAPAEGTEAPEETPAEAPEAPAEEKPAEEPQQ